MSGLSQSEGLFESPATFPDPDAQQRLDRLVGLDDKIKRLTNMLAILINPGGLKAWADAHLKGGQHLADTVLRRPPLVVLEGDVGSGKTELAETIGDKVARQEDLDITLLPMSLATRGEGRVGEMTRLISQAFKHVVSEAEKLRSARGRSRGAVILLIDEADALAQSREASQMHHEDRAGVNALIRGVDRLAAKGLPAAVVMCTNRLGAMDPAVLRRAAEVLRFRRPDEVQRLRVLERALDPIGLTRDEIRQLVQATGPSDGRDYGYTFSDLTQRLLPALVLDAYPSEPIRAHRALEIARTLTPTPPFRDTRS